LSLYQIDAEQIRNDVGREMLPELAAERIVSEPDRSIYAQGC
jgi:hypothetical protein